MVEDMLRITVDQIFPRTFRKKRSSMRSPQKGANRKMSGIHQSVMMGAVTNNTLDCIQEEEKIASQDEDLHQDEVNDDEGPEELFELKRKAAKRIHPVTGYPDGQNMWEKLVNIEKSEKMPKEPPQF